MTTTFVSFVLLQFAAAGSMALLSSCVLGEPALDANFHGGQQDVFRPDHTQYRFLDNVRWKDANTGPQ